MVGQRIKTERTQKYNTFGEWYAACTLRGLRVSPSTLLNWEKGQKLPATDAVPIADALEMKLDELLRGPEWREPELPGLDTLQQNPQLIGADT